MRTTILPEAPTPPPPGPAPNAGVRPAYASPKPAAPIDLWLAGNEGRPPESSAVCVAAQDLGRYPSSETLTRRIAERHDVEPSRVLVTAGADDALLRLALAYLDQGREIVLPSPTFVMIERYAELAGGTVVRVDWPAGTSYPTEAAIAAITPRTSLVALVSPNNPTGDVASEEALERVVAAAENALVVVDCAYGEFADEDLSTPALAQPRTVVLRTFSKAYGCAGLRVGYALGSAEVIEVLRSAGNPYPCGAPSLAAAVERLSADIAPFVSVVRSERARLLGALQAIGLKAYPSQGNFVYAEGERACQLAELLAGFGIAVRQFPATGGSAAVRITCPGSEAGLDRLLHAIATAGSPEALLFDMDGVLADVSSSYRSAIIQTAAELGVTITAADIEEQKAQGHANDDWALTHRLICAKSVDVTLAEVTERFEALYQGADGVSGLKATETLLLAREELASLARRFRLGVVTGRPRSDAQYFLNQNGLAGLFDVVVTREDAALKPSAEPTELALRRLGVTRAWLVGDTLDDIQSARAAGVLGIGVVPPGAPHDSVAAALVRGGAATVLSDVQDLTRILP